MLGGGLKSQNSERSEHNAAGGCGGGCKPEAEPLKIFDISDFQTPRKGFLKKTIFLQFFA